MVAGRAEGVELGAGSSPSGPGTGVPHLPLRLASPAWHALISMPWWRANSIVGGCSRNRLPCDTPSAPIRSVRPTLGTPPTASKKRDQPLEGVLPVHRRREPPQPPPATSTRCTRSTTPRPAPNARSKSLQSEKSNWHSSAGRRLDRHAHRRRRPEPGTAQIPQVAHHRRIRPREPLRGDDLEHAASPAASPPAAAPARRSAPPTPRRSPARRGRCVRAGGGPPLRNHFEIVAG